MDGRYWLLVVLWVLVLSGIVVDGFHPIRDIALVVCVAILSVSGIRAIRSRE